MAFTKQDYDEFENVTLRPAWAYKKAKGRVDGDYPSHMKPSEIHKILFGGPPNSSMRRDILKEMDARHGKPDSNNKDYLVVFMHGPNKYNYIITDVPTKEKAKRIAIGKYINENRYGHNSFPMVNGLISKGVIELEITPTR